MVLSERGQKAAAAVKMLTAAREYLTPENHWVQRHLVRGDAVCAIGAIGVTAKAMVGTNTAATVAKIQSVKGGQEGLRALSLALAPQQEGEAGWIPSVNDDPGTTHGMILAAFDKAIAAECKVVQQESAVIDSASWTGRP